MMIHRKKYDYMIIGLTMHTLLVYKRFLSAGHSLFILIITVLEEVQFCDLLLMSF